MWITSLVIHTLCTNFSDLSTFSSLQPTKQKCYTTYISRKTQIPSDFQSVTRISNASDFQGNSAKESQS